MNVYDPCSFLLYQLSTAPSWPDSSTGRALHQPCRGQDSNPHSGLNFSSLSGYCRSSIKNKLWGSFTSISIKILLTMSYFSLLLWVGFGDSEGTPSENGKWRSVRFCWCSENFFVLLYNYPPKGRWIVVDIYRDAKRRGIYPPLFTDPEGIVLVFTKSNG